MIDHITYTATDVIEEPTATPQMRLHKAILARAIEDCFGLVSLQNKVANEHEISGAQRLLTGQNPALHRICECAGINAGALVRAIKPMIEEYQQTGAAPDVIQARKRNGKRKAAVMKHSCSEPLNTYSKPIGNDRPLPQPTPSIQPEPPHGH